MDNNRVRGGIVGPHTSPEASDSGASVRGTAEECAKERLARAGDAAAVSGAARL